MRAPAGPEPASVLVHVRVTAPSTVVGSTSSVADGGLVSTTFFHVLVGTTGPPRWSSKTMDAWFGTTAPSATPAFSRAVIRSEPCPSGGVASGGRKSEYGVGVNGSSRSGGPAKWAVTTPSPSTEASTSTARPAASAVDPVTAPASAAVSGTGTPPTSAPTTRTDAGSTTAGNRSTTVTRCAAADADA